MSADDAATSTSLWSDGELSDSPTISRRQGKKRGVPYPADGKCHLCLDKKVVSKTNWSRHLKTVHPKELAAAETAIPSDQTTLDKHVVIDHPNRLFALYAATSTFPANHLSNKYLKEFLSKQPNFKIPCARTLVAQMEKEKTSLQALLVEKINASKYKCSLGVDIVTTKGLVHSLMGVTAHIVNTKNQAVECFALSIIELCERHTGEYIAREFNQLLANLKIRREKVLRVVTDCGSNMVAAFFEPFTCGDEEPEQPVVWTHAMVDAADVQVNQLYGLEEEAPEDAEEEAVEGADEEDRTGEELHSSLPESQDELRFTHNALVKCAAHRLNSCLKGSFEKSKRLEKLRKRVFRVIGKFAKSHRATKMLFVESRSRNPNGRGLKLLFPADTRWASVVLCYSRILRVRESLEVVCQELDYPGISNADFALMDIVVQVVHAFRGFMLVLQHQSKPTISVVLPGVQNLIRFLELKATDGALPVICQSLIEGLQRRFKDVLDSGQPDSDPLYLAAACVDPVVQKRERYLDENFVQASAAIRQMAVALQLDVDAEVSVLHEAENITERSPYGFDVPPKRPRTEPTSQRDKLKSEIIEYKALIDSEEVSDSLMFWKQHKQQFQVLSTIAFNLLSVPGASSAVEQLFSHVSKHSTGTKSASGPDTIIRRSLLTFNERFIEL